MRAIEIGCEPTSLDIFSGPLTAHPLRSSDGFDMRSEHHRPQRPPPDGGASRHGRVTVQLHPALTDVLKALDGMPFGQDFRERAVEVSTSKLLSDPVDHGTALTAFRWVLDHADGDGLPLTAAGYLKPADVRALAAVLPTMHDWPFAMAHEIDVHPVLCFREYLMSMGLLRRYKGSLRLTKAGRDARGDASLLWMHLADTLVPVDPGLDAEASAVILVHAATTDEEIDIDAVMRTLTALGWTYQDGSPIDIGEVYDIWNELWTVLGNVGERTGHDDLDRTLSPEARIIIHDALFDEIPDTPIT